MKKYGFFIASILLTSCANVPSQSEVERLAAQARIRDSAPICNNDNCQKKWDAAQVWVSQNSAFKIQTVSTAIIETYSPTNGDPRLAYQITKAPYKDGQYQIIIKAYCANWLLGCNPSPLDAAQSFNNYINSIN